MRSIILPVILLLAHISFAQTSDTIKYWHDKERSIHYKPAGNDLVCVNPKLRFNRALYGTNTGFRVEAGDLPEFALYMPGMGGNLKFGLISNDKSKWLIDAQSIKTTYRPGSMIYEIKDAMLGNGSLTITVLALADGEGMVIKTAFSNVNTSAELLWVFGGASGKKFSRDGDIGADPESSFYLQADNCKNNIYQVKNNIFHLSYGSDKILTEEERYEINQFPNDPKKDSSKNDGWKHLMGVVPVSSDMHLADPAKQNTPLELYQTKNSETSVVAGKMMITNAVNYFLIQNPVAAGHKNGSAAEKFNDAETARENLAGRIKVNTPDPYINTLGSALSMAADAIWEDPSYLHGAVAWRMRLNAWRGAYVADPLGWHDRARKHFSSYALSQITTAPASGVVADTALHLARHIEKVGTYLFSDGYICRNPNGDIRAHHYDMNLVFVDQLLNHFSWTGDTSYVRAMWPLIKRHLAWEKRNFDMDGDGLYDAYAAIWASDALQYSGGGVTHSSAYNYRANKMAAELAKLIGEDGTQYATEANKIYTTVQKNLWLSKQGSYAEYKDLLGKKLVHPSPGLWTIYHAIDSKLPDAFQSYQCLRYIDENIPHIPVQAKGFAEKDLYLLGTTNWQPYTWSLNNVVLAENLHTSLAYWQGNRSEEAYRLWRSAMIESMYMSASPGGFEQLSFYDAIRGELYRDFADPIGVAARTLVEGLFGIQPDALHDTIHIRPGFPLSWNYAGLKTPDVDLNFNRKGTTDTYIIEQYFNKTLSLKLLLTPYKDGIEKITINGVPAKWKIQAGSVGSPLLQVEMAAAKKFSIIIYWKGNSIAKPKNEYTVGYNKKFELTLPGYKLLKLYDPQTTLKNVQLSGSKISGTAIAYYFKSGFFVKVKQGIFEWWQPIDLNVSPDLDLTRFYSSRPAKLLFDSVDQSIKKIDLSNYFNEKVTNIFKQQYLSPRPKSPTLQLPTQGIGNWCYPLTMANIDDIGMRKMAGTNNEIKTPDDIPFATPSDTILNNIVFTSQWDNFPDSVIIPLSGNASQAYLLMAGSTNPMQSRVTNGMIVVAYTDGSSDTLLLNNPGNWWPIEQDYYIDGYAFKTTWEDLPERLYLKEGKFGRGSSSYTSIKGFTNMAIDGGAATVLDMYLNKNKTLRSLTIHAIANDVVIGLMAVTLE